MKRHYFMIANLLVIAVTITTDFTDVESLILSMFMLK